MKTNQLLYFCLLFFVVAACNQKTATEENNKTTKLETESAEKQAIKKPSKAKNLVQLELGSELPMTDLKMKDGAGKELSINDVKRKNGLLLMFSCNTCPYVVAWEDRYPEIAKYCQLQDVGMLVVNPNEKQRDGVDSADEMKKHAEEQKYNFPYLIDENHKLADAIGATRTPELFLFDKDLKLVYKGAIDDNMKEPEKVENFYVKNAVNKMIKGEPIDPSITKSIGCTIKRTQKI